MSNTSDSSISSDSAPAAPNVLVFTDAAAGKVGELIREEANPALKLRVFVSGGGCSGFQYSLSFDVQKEGDAAQEIDGTKILVDEISLPYIAGTTLDYVEGLHAGGFRFDNPRASRTCGCGSSFSA